MQTWYEEVKNSAETDALIFLVANKKDKESEREVSREKGEQFATERGLSGFFETSAKTGENVEATFMMAGRRLFKKYFRKIREDKLRVN